jgi:hypothetical protein
MKLLYIKSDIPTQTERERSARRACWVLGISAAVVFLLLGRAIVASGYEQRVSGAGGLLPTSQGDARCSSFSDPPRMVREGGRPLVSGERKTESFACVSDATERRLFETPNPLLAVFVTRRVVAWPDSASEKVTSGTRRCRSW